MTVAPVSSSTSTASAAAAAAGKTATVNYNQFLQLLVTEMKNQDPTNPMDATQQLSQLASFSAVEQQVQTNTTLASLLSTANLSQAESAIGRTVKSSDGTISGVVSSVTLSSGGATANLTDGSTLTLGGGVTIS
jgi:flagellar basal-body rod modification protein FlgD